MDEMNRGEKLGYEAKERDVIAFLEGKHSIVLATSLDDRVTARTVSFVNDGLDVLFMSWGHNTKCVQIRANPRVALCRDQVQIEGRAEILGSLSDPANQSYAELLKKKYPREFTGFAHQPGMVLVRVVPSKIGVFAVIGGQFYVDYLDLREKKVHRQALAGD